MKTMRIFFLTLIIFQFFLVHSAPKAVLVHNTLQDIEACKGKIHLKLIRIWGGEKEDDEHKFFKTPRSIAISKNNEVYISDRDEHCVKVFDLSGKYLRTIGRKGRGPGDLFHSANIALSPRGDLVVLENNGYRIQRFSPQGESKEIIKSKSRMSWSWVGVTSKDKLATYSHRETFNSGKLISIINNKGKIIGKIGKYHDKSKSYLGSERLNFCLDDSDYFYAANSGTAILRKYSHEGRLVLVITFDTPFEQPVKVALSSDGKEIERIEEDKKQEDVRVKGKAGGVAFQRKGKQRQAICMGIGTDSRKRIFLVSQKRKLTEKEVKAGSIMLSLNGPIVRDYVDYDVLENIDAYRLLVFSPGGKIIAETTMTTLSSDIYVWADRLFILDGTINQRIIEYKVSFENE